MLISIFDVHQLLKVVLLLRAEPLARSLFGRTAKLIGVLVLIIGSQGHIGLPNNLLFRTRIVRFAGTRRFQCLLILFKAVIGGIKTGWRIRLSNQFNRRQNRIPNHILSLGMLFVTRQACSDLKVRWLRCGEPLDVQDVMINLLRLVPLPKNIFRCVDRWQLLRIHSLTAIVDPLRPILVQLDGRGARVLRQLVYEVVAIGLHLLLEPLLILLHPLHGLADHLRLDQLCIRCRLHHPTNKLKLLFKYYI